MLGPALLLAAVVAEMAPSREPARIVVDFTADGRCAVNTQGDAYRADLSYLPPAGLSPAFELRCAVPGPPKGQPVVLQVDLPPGVAPAGGEFPQLVWHERNHRWSGEASLPAAPAFVRVPRGRSGLGLIEVVFGDATSDDRITMGWNFYGWFVFAASFIAIYFAWARATARRT
jgi:hypothetical protein